MMTRFPAALLFVALSSLAVGQEKRGDNPDARPLTPEEQLARFHVPPGFEVQLVAAEPDIQKPMNLNFDAAGRLWMTGSELYPWPAKRDANGQPIAAFQQNWDDAAKQFGVRDKAPAPKEHGTDTVRVLSDFSPDGRARKIELFADGLNIPTGIQPLPRMAAAPRRSGTGAVQMNSLAYIERLRAEAKGESAIVYSIPNIWMMTDTDGDGRAEARAPLYEGFGFKDTHGMSSNYLHWIDGWIYGCHGFSNHSEIKDRAGKVLVMDSGNTYRFKPDGSKIEYYTHGQTNPFGLTVDPLGNFYSADSHSKPVYMLLRGGYYEGIGKQHDGLGFAPRITEDDHGSSAIAGIAYYADDRWPEEFRGNLFNGNPVTRRINRDRLEWQGASPKAIRMPDFLTCDDPWFRPVQVKLGPDGALWIADFYNPIIGHYEVPLTDPRRDNQHGRIWRVVWRGEKSRNQAASVPGTVGVPPAEVAEGNSGGRRAGEPGSGVPRDPSDLKRPSPSKSAAQQRADGAGKMPAPAGGTPTIPGTMPDLTKLDAARLVEKLADSNLILRTLATNELVARDARNELTASLNRSFGLLRQRAQESKDGALTRGLRQPDDVAWYPEDGNPLLTGSEQQKRVHTLWALARLGAIDESAFREATKFAPLEVQVHAPRQALALKVAEKFRQPETFAIGILWKWKHGEVDAKLQALPESTAKLFKALTPDARVLQAAMDALREHSTSGIEMPLQEWCMSVMEASETFPPADIQLRYATDLTIRENLAKLSSIINVINQTKDKPAWAQRLADIALAVATPESADFLLAHLDRTKLTAPRAGEYLRHAALHLPAEKFGTLVFLVKKLGDAPLVQKLAVADGLTQATRQRGMKLPEPLGAWTERVMVEALGSNDTALLDRAIAAVREAKLPGKFEPLRKVVTDSKGHGPRRAAALEALMNLEAGREVAGYALADPSSMTLRKKAADLLAPMAADKKIEGTLLATLPIAPWEIASTISAGLAKTEAGTEALLALIEGGKAAPALLRNKAVAAQLAARSVPLKNRAAALTKDLPPEDARLDAVIAQRVESFRNAQPNAAKGAQLFAQQCVACHRFRDIGGNVGPNLDGMAARGVHRLAEDILDPNRNLDPAFRQTVIETTDGQTLAGVNVRDQGNALALSDATGKELTIPKASIKTRTESRLSLMPPVFESQLTPADFNDLLAYLLAPVN